MGLRDPSEDYATFLSEVSKFHQEKTQYPVARNSDKNVPQTIDAGKLDKYNKLSINSLLVRDSVNTLIGTKHINKVITDNISVILPPNRKYDTKGIEIAKTFPASSGPKSENKFYQTNHFNKSLITVIFLFVITSFGLIIYNYQEYIWPQNSVNHLLKSYPDIEIVQPAEWGAISNFSNHSCCPFKYVNWVIVHTLKQEHPCTNLQECSVQVENLQYYYDSNFIKHTKTKPRENFIVGGDERIYIGRGWESVQKINNLKIGILFGTDSSVISKKQLYLILLLINIGRKCGKVTTFLNITLRCKSNCEDVAKTLDLVEQGLFKVDSLKMFVKDTITIGQNLGVVEGQQQCSQTGCGLHYNSTCVLCLPQNQ